LFIARCACVCRLDLALLGPLREFGLLTGRVTRITGLAPLSGTASTSATDFRHVPSIQADLFAALSTGSARFIRREFMCLALFVSRTSAFAGNFALTAFIHGGKASIACTGVRFGMHCKLPSFGQTADRRS
jgi:hypothetical protein